MHTDTPPPRPDLAPTPRIALIDALRGAAIIGMIVYHIAWDLSYFWFIQVDVATEPGWVAFARTLVAIFLLLVGTGLVLAHGRGIRWRAFGKRFAMLAGAALAVSVVTYFAFPESFVFFGVLHAIALLSLLALPFLRAPAWLVLAVAVAAIALALSYSNPAFNSRWLAWIGLWSEVPVTNDLVPVLPWLGVVLIGVVVTRWALRSGLAERLARIRPHNRAFAALVWAGRWSLVIYLVHQPLLLGILYPAAQVFRPEEARRDIQFLSSCQSGCETARGEVAACEAYCSCSLDTVEARNFWADIAIDNPGPAQNAALGEITRQCTPVLEDFLAREAP